MRVRHPLNGNRKPNPRKSGQGYALRPANVAEDSPARPAIMAAGEMLLERLGPYLPERKRAFRSKDEATFLATLLGLIVLLALGALLTIPDPKGIKIGVRRNLYSGTGISHDYLCQFLDALKRAGLIAIRTGYRDETGKRFVSRIIPLPPLLALFREAGVKLSDLRTAPDKVLLLRNAEWSEPPAQVMADCDLIRRLNETNAKHDLRLTDEARQRVIERLSAGHYYDQAGKLRQVRGGWDESSIYLIRIFTKSWSEGARLYGGCWQNTPKEEREHYRIDGQETVERDFSTLHPRILYAMEGVTGELNFDPYVVPGFSHIDRSVGKTTFARLLNGRFREAAIKEPWRNLYPLKFGKAEKALRNEQEEPMFRDRDEFRRYVAAMRAHLHTIDKHLGKEYGLKLQKKDSDLALSVVKKFVDRDMPIYPIHDSFIVRKKDEEFLRECMAESLIEHLSD